MSVIVNHKTFGDVTSPEFDAGEELKKKFQDFFPNTVSGEVNIYSCVTLTGGQVRKDIDLFIVGFLSGYHQVIECPTYDIANRSDIPSKRQDVEIKSFFYPIELKDHISNRVLLDGLNNIKVKYGNSWHNVTVQSFQQQTALQNILQDELGASPFIRNLIWFRQFNEEDAWKIFGSRCLNVLIGDFDVSQMFERAVSFFANLRKVILLPDGRTICDDISSANKSVVNKLSVEDVISLFAKVKQGCGNLTRQKMELLTAQLVDEERFDEIGQKLSLIKGRAGTGKTVRLLQQAKQLSDKGKRCLLLTYNHALVSDIKRLIAICGIPDGIDEGTVQVSTLHLFFYSLMKDFGIIEVKPFVNFDEDYKDALLRLKEATATKKIDITWDFIFIDEGQDWSDVEKEILFQIFGKERIVVADGIDQYMRSLKRQNWVNGLPNGEVVMHRYDMGLRQKSNLSSFVSAFAVYFGIPWNLKKNNFFKGGQVIITNKYNSNLHSKLAAQLKEDGNALYDMLILAPPSLVKIGEDGKHHFAPYDKYREKNIFLFDGSNEDNRMKYPSNLLESRLFQYDSCRGLEGWVVVCLNFDDLISYKMNTYSDDSSEEGDMIDPDIKRKASVYLWSLMPLTRAIDTLVIVLRDANSEVGKGLKSIAESMSDFVSWEI